MSSLSPLLIYLLLSPALASPTYSLTGCLCYSDCARTIDSPFNLICDTSVAATPIPKFNGTTCGVYNSLHGGYVDYCLYNSTAASGASWSSSIPIVTLTTFWGMWLYMCAAAVTGVSVVYALVGLALVLLLVRTARDPHSPAPIKARLTAGLVQSPLAWLAFVLAGACHGLLPGALLAAILSFVYLCMPYAIDSAVAITLGLTVAAVVLFFACNRGGGEVRSKLHASIYE